MKDPYSAMDQSSSFSLIAVITLTLRYMTQGHSAAYYNSRLCRAQRLTSIGDLAVRDYSESENVSV